MKKVIVVGGGASGLMAAYSAACKGNDVILIEKNEKLGKKIYITGKGRCNFTNDSSPDDFLQNVVRGEKFLRGVVYSFPPQKTIDFFENNGLSVKIERGNRVFPSSDHASDVTKTLEKACKNAGVCIKLNEKVEKIIVETCTMPDIIPMPRVVKLCSDKGEYACDYIIIATGGISYPSTGSTGDGYTFARSVGHTITELKSALCGINLQGDDFLSLQGLSLKNVAISVKNSGKIVFSDFGEA
ncbi:MAG: aminoacetone oxidase family FAD-binding enzyme, partial [Clostridiales bacterium]|nr:aminoacetone oxidase family FAD-binding enzyme [Clostridiales bacterium]